MGVPCGQRRIAAVAQCAVQLNGGVDHLVHHVGQEHLGDGVFQAQVEALFGLVGDVQQHQPGHVEFGGAIGEHPLHALTLGEFLAEGRALRHMGRGHVQRPLGHGDVVHAVAQPAVGQAMLTHVEAIALAAEQIFRRHDQVLDVDLRMAAAHDVRQRAFHRHGRDVALDDVAGVGQFDDEGRIALMARRVRIGHGHDHGQIGGAGGG